MMFIAGKSIRNASDAEVSRPTRLAEVAYTMAKEAIAFVKFPDLAAMLRRVGVNVGETYMNNKFAYKISVIMGELTAGDINDMLKQADFFFNIS